MDEINDLSKAIDTVQQLLSDENSGEKIQDILGLLSATEEQETDKSQSNQPSFDLSSLFSNDKTQDDDSGIDMATIMKIANVLSAMNSQNTDPSSAFLKTLKPFLNDNRRSKLDQAQKLLKIAKAIKIFKNEK